MSIVTNDQDTRAYVAANVQHRLGVARKSTYWLMKQTGELPNRIYPVVRGDAMASAGLLSRIAEALDCTADALLSKPSKNILEKFLEKYAESA